MEMKNGTRGGVKNRHSGHEIKWCCTNTKGLSHHFLHLFHGAVLSPSSPAVFLHCMHEAEHKRHPVACRKTPKNALKKDSAYYSSQGHSLHRHISTLSLLNLSDLDKSAELNAFSTRQTRAIDMFDYSMNQPLLNPYAG